MTSLGIDEPKDPGGFHLSQNYPNPASSSTTITYELGNAGNASLIFMDVAGREIRTAFNESKPAGKYSLTVNCSDLGPGIYYYRLNAGNFTQTRKMVIAK
jgi:hypothetical protein